MTLKEFLLNKMRMSHIYQPLFIKTLVEHEGRCNRTDIAKELLMYDNSQVEYYEKIVDCMPGKVLRNHKIVTRVREEKDYILLNYERLSESDKKEVVDICQQKIDEYMAKRGMDIWNHRRKNRKAVSGSIRYKVLSRANGRCELCGVSKDIKALEVDHIVPKNLGGEDSINNYQALCYTCNTNKGDRDSRDFRDIQAIYKVKKKSCLFCNINKGRVLAENNLAYAIKDKFPVTSDHILIIPKRHSRNYFELHQSEINAINQLIHLSRERIQLADREVSAFNIGMNNGQEAGQTILHTHIHLIPRRRGDVEDPTGGVRNIIAGKGNYL